MNLTGKIMSRIAVLVCILLLTWCVCSCNRFLEPKQDVRKQDDNIKVVVITAGHEFEEESFFGVFEGYDDIEYVEARQKDQSEIFEDISRWDYDVMVLYHMSQNISPKWRENFVKLLERGVGVVALHHSIGAFQGWGEYRKIIGGKYYLKETEEDGVVYEASGYKHDVDFMVNIEDAGHPITRGMRDFVVHDETYKRVVFEKDSQMLLSTVHSTSDGPLCWIRQYDKAKVCYIQMGHGAGAYTNPNYRQLVIQAIRWCVRAQTGGELK